MLSLTSFQLEGILTDTGGSVKISNDILTDTALSFTNETILLTRNDGSAKELMVATASGGTLTISQRGLDSSTTKTTDTDLQHEFRTGTIGRVVASASDLVDKEGDTMQGLLQFTGTGHAGIKLNNLTTAQRNALTPSNGMMIYNSDDGVVQQYIAGAWADVDTGSGVVNASTTVAGKGEVNTTAESKNGTDVGGSGAPTWTLASDIAANDQSNTFKYGVDAGGDDTYVVALTPVLASYTEGQRLTFTPTTTNTGACSVDFGPGVLNIKTKDGNDPQDGVIRASKPVTGTYDGTNFILDNEDFATADNKGIVEMCTDAEAATATDETRYVNSKQAAIDTNVVIQTFTFDDAPISNIVIAHGLSKIPRAIITTLVVKDVSDGEYNSGFASYDGSTIVQKCYRNDDTPTVENVLVTWADDAASNEYSQWTISSIDSTNVTLTHSYNGVFATPSDRDIMFSFIG